MFGVCLVIESVFLLLWDLVNDSRKIEQTDVSCLSDNKQRSTWGWLAHSHYRVSDSIRLKHHSSEFVPSDE